MTNHTATFTCATDATLAISLVKGRKNWKIVPTFKDTDAKKARTGAKQYFDLDEAGGKQAQVAFDTLVEEAKAAGWTLTAKAAQAPASRGFTGIPKAPTPTPTPKPVAASASGPSSSAPRAAARR